MSAASKDQKQFLQCIKILQNMYLGGPQPRVTLTNSSSNVPVFNSRLFPKAESCSSDVQCTYNRYNAEMSCIMSASLPYYQCIAPIHAESERQSCLAYGFGAHCLVRNPPLLGMPLKPACSSASSSSAEIKAGAVLCSPFSRSCSAAEGRMLSLPQSRVSFSMMAVPSETSRRLRGCFLQNCVGREA